MEQPNISTPPQTNLPPKPEPISPPLLIVTFVLSLFLAGSIGFLLGKSLSQPKTSSPTSISQVSPTPTPETPTPTPDPTANWKTYLNKNYGYLVKYPEYWYLYEPEAESAAVGFWPEKFEGEASGVWVLVHHNPTALMPQEWWEKNIKQFADYNNVLTQTVRKEILVGKIKAYFVQSSEEKGWYSRPFTSVYIAKDKKIYEITTNFEIKSKNYNFFDLILSTFKFLD